MSGIGILGKETTGLSPWRLHEGFRRSVNLCGYVRDKKFSSRLVVICMAKLSRSLPRAKNALGEIWCLAYVPPVYVLICECGATSSLASYPQRMG
eukprot:1571988-Rhodomonas_salina.1